MTNGYNFSGLLNIEFTALVEKFRDIDYDGSDPEQRRRMVQFRQAIEAEMDRRRAQTNERNRREELLSKRQK